jgi:hypothetical protein
MAYAPTCEQGVVFLFGRLAPRLGFHVESVQVHCPDCVAKYRGKECRIEFEFWASRYQTHRHHPKKVDTIVCWENDWAARPKKYRHLQIVDLKRYVDAMPRVFVVGCSAHWNIKDLDTRKRIEWNVRASAQMGDLILMYRAGKFGAAIKDIWKIDGDFTHYGPRNRQDRRPGLQAEMKLIARLAKPLTFRELATNPATRELGIVRKRFIGKTDITEDWHLIYGRIVRKNPGARRKLKPFIVD